MTTQLRHKDAADPRFVDPNRDLAHCFPLLVQKAALLIDQSAWPVFQAYLAREGITVDQLGDVCESLCKFTTGCLERSEDTMEDCLIRAGYMDLKREATFAYLAVLGSIVVGGVFTGRRQAVAGDDTINWEYSLLHRARKILLLQSMSPWRRRLYFLWRDIKRSWRRTRRPTQ